MLSAVFCAIEEDNKTGLEELLAMANIDISQVGRWPIFTSVRLDVANIYLSQGIDVDSIYLGQVGRGQYLPQSGRTLANIYLSQGIDVDSIYLGQVGRGQYLPHTG